MLLACSLPASSGDGGIAADPTSTDYDGTTYSYTRVLDEEGYHSSLISFEAGSDKFLRL